MIDGGIVAKPLILLTNDDGIYAQGILAAWQELRKIGDVEVVAPDAERSAVGHAITLLLPLRTKEVVRRNVRFGYAVNGMPADCVKIAIKAILPRPPDLVVSGINLGSNTGTNVIYSGTVSAATEARILGIPSIAVSLATFTQPDFTYAAKFTRKLALQVIARGLPDKTLLNVNIPNLPEEKIKGVAITRQGDSRVEERMENRANPRNQTYYWLDSTFKLQEMEEHADAKMVNEGYVSITPVSYDLTAYPAVETLEHWTPQPAPTGFLSRPIRSTSASITSPRLRYSGGLRPSPTPCGVPVEMQSPGSSVIPADRSAMMRATEKIMSPVLLSCLATPLTDSCRRRRCGSGISSAVTITGPIGQLPSSDFPLHHCDVRNWRSRADTSLKTV